MNLLAGVEWRRILRGFLSNGVAEAVGTNPKSGGVNLMTIRESSRVLALNGTDIRGYINWVLRAFAVAVCALALSVCAAHAQGTADVVGTVTDTSGGVIPGATVTLTNSGTGISQTSTSSATGEFVFDLVPSRHICSQGRGEGVQDLRCAELGPVIG